MIPDRIIEQDTLVIDGPRTSVEVRIPWYRAIPASCIAEATLAVDGVPANRESLLWTMNGRTFTFPELKGNVEQWWFPLDSVVLSGELPVAGDGEHVVDVGLKIYLPYLIMDGDQVLHIEEHDRKTMKANRA